MKRERPAQLIRFSGAKLLKKIATPLRSTLCHNDDIFFDIFWLTSLWLSATY
jgi:hypothetical protein